MQAVIGYGTCYEDEQTLYVGIIAMINPENDDNIIGYIVYDADTADDEDVETEKHIIHNFGVAGVNE